MLRDNENLHRPQESSAFFEQFDDGPFAFNENPAAFDRTRGAGRKSGTRFNPEEREEDERIYREAILRFVEEKRLENVLSQGEIASLQRYDRFRTLMHGILPNIVHLFQRSSRADTKLGVLVLIHFCADNADGLCRLPETRFAELLNRDVRNIRRAIDDLEEGGEIGVHHNAAGNSYWPIIDRVVRDTDPALGWFINAFSEPSNPRGRPRKYQGADAPYFSEETLSTEKYRAQSSKVQGADALHRGLREVANKREEKERNVRLSAPFSATSGCWEW